MAQSIAPYIQQNQQDGYQDALQALQLGGGAVNPNLQSANTISALTKAFSQLGGAQQPGGEAALANYLRTFGTKSQQIDQSPYNPSAPTDQIGDISGGGASDMSWLFPQTGVSGYTPDLVGQWSEAGGGNGYDYSFGQ
jgi:hypothetical protein